MQAERSGRLPQNYTIDWRASSGLQYLNATIDGRRGVVSKYRKQYFLKSFSNVTRDLSGGFYEDGPYGPVKLTKTNAMSTALTAWAALDLPEPFEEQTDELGGTLMVRLHAHCPSCIHLVEFHSTRACLSRVYGDGVHWLVAHMPLLRGVRDSLKTHAATPRCRDRVISCGRGQCVSRVCVQDDALDIVEHGLTYLLQCFIQDPTNYVNAQGDVYVYQVGNVERESGRWFRPEDVKVSPPPPPPRPSSRDPPPFLLIGAQ